MKKAFISLGTNLGDKKKNLFKAIQYINVGVGHVIDLSGVYETEPWGFESKENFLNMVVGIISELTPGEMLSKCLEIEELLGRTRGAESGYVSRVIDIDILFYSDQIINTDSISIPHIHLQDRRFVLEPLCEIAADFIHPVLGVSISTLLTNCTDKSSIKQLGSLSSAV